MLVCKIIISLFGVQMLMNKHLIMSRHLIYCLLASLCYISTQGHVTYSHLSNTIK